MNLKFPLLVALMMFCIEAIHAQNVLSPADLLSLKASRTVQMHPDGNQLIYAVYTPRTANEKPGGSHGKYMLANLKTREPKALFADSLKAYSPLWNAAGDALAFKMVVEGKVQVFVSVGDDFNPIQVTNAVNGVNTYAWNPDGKSFVYTSTSVATDKEKELRKRGYGFIFYEENLKNDNLFKAEFDADYKLIKETQLSKDVNVWDFAFDKAGKQLAYTATELKLIDQKYMFRKIHIYNLETQKLTQVIDNVGKLGDYDFSPNGEQLCYTGAFNINDHGVSTLYTVNVADGIITNVTPEKYKAHIAWANWKSDKELIYLAHEGVYPKLFSYKPKGDKHTLLLDAKEAGAIFSTPVYSSDFKSMAFTGNTPSDMSNIYTWDGKGKPSILSNINPELASKTLGEQEIVSFEARDGLNIEGLLIKPVNYKEGEKYPLVLYVHGGPESHHSNGWLSRYSTPGQVMAGKGYLVAYINYRASTGYGVDFGMEGFGEPAGKEFDDLADAIDYLVKEKGADRNRVGMAGGSYGGYASAWFATYYTEYVKAVAMFVGISNIISKKGTTDIAYEELYVHSGKPLEEQWEMNLKRSPIYHAHKSKTATLIYGGAVDPRIDPGQSKELYRRMKMNGHPAVRLVQYPGEGHGNRKQVGQIDVLYRQIDWLDWYVKDVKPLDGPMPNLDISDKYGLDWTF